MGLRNAILNEYTNWRLARINEKIDIRGLFEKYKVPRSRTLAVRLVDVGDSVGFVFTSEGLRALSEIKDPTVQVLCTKRVYSAVISGKMRPSELFLNEELATVVGGHTLQDAIFFEALCKEVFKET